MDILLDDARLAHGLSSEKDDFDFGLAGHCAADWMIHNSNNIKRIINSAGDE